MNKTNLNTNSNLDASSFSDEEIDLKKLFKIIWDGKSLIIFSTSIFSIVAVIISLSLPDIYQSQALLSPAKSSESSNSTIKNYGGLASLAGINLSQGGSDRTSTALKKLNSLSFYQENILPKIFLPDLMALAAWDSKTNTLIYDEGLYDKKTNTWKRVVKYPKTQNPSAQESFKIFYQNHISVNEDINTGFITLTVKHQSPHVARDWAELMVNEINNFFRAKDKIEGQSSINFLNIRMSETRYTEIKQAIAELIQQKLQQLMLIESSDYYVFNYIDPPVAAELKHEPKRAKICILGAVLGLLTGLLIIFIRKYFSRADE
jgi:LPS O-antigen subunit length determinant protein (WzzB/FepE family)